MRKKHIGSAINKIERLITRNLDNIVSNTIADDISLAKALIIDFINFNAKHKDVYQKDIEAEFGVNRAAVSLLLKKMEAQLLIERLSVDSDFRLKKIVLTEKSHSISKSISEILEKSEEQISNGITDKEMGVFFNVLDKIIKNLENEE